MVAHRLPGGGGIAGEQGLEHRLVLAQRRLGAAVVSMSFSKWLGLAGLRVGAFVAAPALAAEIAGWAAGAVVGVVTGIQGKKTFEVEIRGAKGHAGTLPMAGRRDAVAAFGRVATALHEAIGARDPEALFTIGRVEVSPNAPSVVADRVRFRIDLRHPDNAVLDACGDLVGTVAAARAAPCAATVTPLVSAPSNGFDETLRGMIAEAAAARGVAAMPVLSFAGHDARQMAGLAPSAMIFIPCRGGVSHAPEEWAEPAHVAAGAQVLCDVLGRLALAPTSAAAARR